MFAYLDLPIILIRRSMIQIQYNNLTVYSQYLRVQLCDCVKWMLPYPFKDVELDQGVIHIICYFVFFVWKLNVLFHFTFNILQLWLTIGLCFCHQPHKPKALIEHVQSRCSWTSKLLQRQYQAKWWVPIMIALEGSLWLVHNSKTNVAANDWKFRSTAKLGYRFTLQKLKLCALSMYIEIHCSCPILINLYIIVELFLASTRTLLSSGFVFLCTFNSYAFFFLSMLIPAL